MRSEYTEEIFHYYLQCIKNKSSTFAITAITEYSSLELIAIIGEQLAMPIAEILNADREFIKFLTDSTSVLQWVKECSRQIKSFIENRIGEIIQTFKNFDK